VIILDCHSRSENPIARALSNLPHRPFILDEVQCGALEGFLQSLKFQDLEEQVAVASLWGTDAYFTGQHGNTWQETGLLWWRGKKYPRTYKSYQKLLTRAYDACFEQSEDFVVALLESGNAILTHDMGKVNPLKTTLTPMEYCLQLYRLRARAQQMMMME
jgi:hypothetical protein